MGVENVKWNLVPIVGFYSLLALISKLVLRIKRKINFQRYSFIGNAVARTFGNNQSYEN